MNEIRSEGVHEDYTVVNHFLEVKCLLNFPQANFGHFVVRIFLNYPFENFLSNFDEPQQSQENEATATEFYANWNCRVGLPLNVLNWGYNEPGGDKRCSEQHSDPFDAFFLDVRLVSQDIVNAD